MAFTTNDLAVIQAAIASGTLEVQYEDRKVRYQTTADLLKAKASIEADLRANGLLSAAPAALPRTAYAEFSRD